MPKLTVDKIGGKLGRKVDLKTLEEANLSNHRLDNLGSFANCKALTRVNLSNNRFSREKQLVGLFNAPLLRNVDLRGCPITKKSSYRHYMISHMHLLIQLDGERVTPEEREAAYDSYPECRPPGWTPTDDDALYEQWIGRWTDDSYVVVDEEEAGPASRSTSRGKLGRTTSKGKETLFSEKKNRVEEEGVSNEVVAPVVERKRTVTPRTKLDVSDDFAADVFGVSATKDKKRGKGKRVKTKDTTTLAAEVTAATPKDVAKQLGVEGEEEEGEESGEVEENADNAEAPTPDEAPNTTESADAQPTSADPQDDTKPTSADLQNDTKPITADPESDTKPTSGGEGEGMVLNSGESAAPGSSEGIFSAEVSEGGAAAQARDWSKRYDQLFGGGVFEEDDEPEPTATATSSVDHANVLGESESEDDSIFFTNVSTEVDKLLKDKPSKEQTPVAEPSKDATKTNKPANSSGASALDALAAAAAKPIEASPIEEDSESEKESESGSESEEDVPAVAVTEKADAAAPAKQPPSPAATNDEDESSESESGSESDSESSSSDVDVESAFEFLLRSFKGTGEWVGDIRFVVVDDDCPNVIVRVTEDDIEFLSEDQIDNTRLQASVQATADAVRGWLCGDRPADELFDEDDARVKERTEGTFVAFSEQFNLIPALFEAFLEYDSDDEESEEEPEWKAHPLIQKYYATFDEVTQVEHSFKLLAPACTDIDSWPGSVRLRVGKALKTLSEKEGKIVVEDGINIPASDAAVSVSVPISAWLDFVNGTHSLMYAYLKGDLGACDSLDDLGDVCECFSFSPRLFARLVAAMMKNA